MVTRASFVKLMIAAGVVSLAGGSTLLAAPMAQATRSIPWDGDKSLRVTLGADVVYVQGPRAAVTVTGDPELVQHIIMRDGHIHVDSAWARQFWEERRDVGKVKLTVTAPAVEHFVFNSGGSFSIENYNHEQLNFTHNGGGTARVSGRASTVHYVLNGGAAVDLSNLRTESARVVVNGRGDLSVGASGEMAATVNGSGRITLLNRPAELRKRVNGSGQIVGG